MKSITLSFYHILSKSNNKGEAPVYARIKLNNRQINLSSGQWLSPSQWNKTKSKAKGSEYKIAEINKNLKEFEEKVFSIINDLRYEGKPLSLISIKERLRLKQKSSETLLCLYDYYIKNIEEHLNNGYAKATIQIYKSNRKKIQAFLKAPPYKCEDIKLEKLDYDFIARFDAFLSSGEYNNKANTIQKEIKRLKAIIHCGIKLGWIMKDPFKEYKSRATPTNRQFLTQQELQEIEKLDVSDNPKLSITKDIFLFMSYTGVSYSDMHVLSPENISVSINDRYLLLFARKKTEEYCRVPLFDKALHIINKYRQHPVCLNKHTLLPSISNQKLNCNLKEIAELVQLSKPLTCHVARHTFATLSIENGVPLETISKVLGHAQLKTTLIYAKITTAKIDGDFQVMNNLFNNSPKCPIKKISFSET